MTLRDTRRQTKRLELHWALGTHYSELFRAEHEVISSCPSWFEKELK